MEKEHTIHIEADSDDRTGYTLKVSAGASTSELSGVSIAPIQGLPVSLVPTEEFAENIFPETREERFMEESLMKFYEKKGMV